jgi:hypothetical protein
LHIDLRLRVSALAQKPFLKLTGTGRVFEENSFRLTRIQPLAVATQIDSNLSFGVLRILLKAVSCRPVTAVDGRLNRTVLYDFQLVFLRNHRFKSLVFLRRQALLSSHWITLVKLWDIGAGSSWINHAKIRTWNFTAGVSQHYRTSVRLLTSKALVGSVEASMGVFCWEGGTVFNLLLFNYLAVESFKIIPVSLQLLIDLLVPYTNQYKWFGLHSLANFCFCSWAWRSL